MLVTNGTVVTFGKRPSIINDGAVLIQDGVIADVGTTSDVKSEGEEVLDAKGKFIMPGFICGHGHFYGSFARGMPLNVEPPKNFVEVLEKLWWRVDKALLPKDIEYSSKLCLLKAIRSGTTCIMDHHASPNSIRGSLDVVAKAVEDSGLRASLCYEVTDRNGEEGALKGIDENVRFASASYKNIGTAMGLHASLTLSDETLAKAREAAEKHSLGYHIHVAEDKADVDDSLEKSGKRVVERLDAAGIVGGRTLAIHCVHVDRNEIDILQRKKTMVAHCPESNMNNGVGMAPVQDMLDAGICVGLGTDGFTFDMLREMKVAYLLHKLRAGDPRAMTAGEVFKLQVYNNAEIARRLLDVNMGQIEMGAAGDLIIVDYRPPTPLDVDNFPYHVIFGMDSHQIDTTIVGGEVLMKDKILLTLDEDDIIARSGELSKSVWERLE